MMLPPQATIRFPHLATSLARAKIRTMPLPVISDTFRCALTWHNVNTRRDAVNVMHVHSSTLTIANIFSEFDTNVTAAMWNQTVTDTVATQMTITPLDGVGTSVVFPITAAAKWKGAQASGNTIPQAAAILKITTANRGRSYRGRMFLPFVAESVHDDGNYNASAAAAQLAAWQTFVGVINGHGLDFGVASYKLAVFTEQTGLFVEPRTATQRRRQQR